MSLGMLLVSAANLLILAAIAWLVVRLYRKVMK